MRTNKCEGVKKFIMMLPKRILNLNLSAIKINDKTNITVMVTLKNCYLVL